MVCAHMLAIFDYVHNEIIYARYAFTLCISHKITRAENIAMAAARK